MKKILATIILGSNRPGNIKNFIEDLEKKCFDPEQVEVIFSIDKGDMECLHQIQTMQQVSKLHIKYLEGVRSRGYFEANIHYNNCLQLADKDSYFFAVFSDKLRIKTEHWDAHLSKYLHSFEDDLFRVRISIFKNIRYNMNLYDALTRPDNFAFHTRKFLEISGGWGDMWGPDTWIQGVVFFCELLGVNDREIVASDIELEKYYYSDTESQNKPALIRKKMINWSFQFLSNSGIALYNFHRIAAKMALYVKNYSLLSAMKAYHFSFTKQCVNIVDSSQEIICSHPVNTFLLENMMIFHHTKRPIKKLNRLYMKLQRRRSLFKRTAYTLNLIFVKIKWATIATRMQFNPIYKEEYDTAIQFQSGDQFIVEQNTLIAQEVEKQYAQTVQFVETASQDIHYSKINTAS